MTDTLISRLADALRECSDALAVAVSREYGGTQRGYDAQRTAYDRAMAPVERARALMADFAATCDETGVSPQSALIHRNRI